MQNSGIFTRQVNPGLRSKIKNVLVTEEILTARLCRNLHHGVITGVHQCVSHRLFPVLIRENRAADPLIGDHFIAVTVKAFRRVDRARVQRCRRRHGFYRGTRLKSIGHTVISPDIVEILQHGFIVHGIDLFLGIERSQISWVIQVIPVRRIHSKDFTVIGIHDDYANILGSLRPVGPCGHFRLVSLQGAPDDLLHIYIDC